MLQWIASESQSLTQQQRGEALAVPLAIASKVSSRVVARGIRMLFASQTPVDHAVERPTQLVEVPRAALQAGGPVATPVPAAALPAPLENVLQLSEEDMPEDDEPAEVVRSIEDRVEQVVIPDKVLPPATRVSAVAQ